VGTFDINWSATLTGGAGAIGTVIGPGAGGQDVVATAANIAVGCIPAGVVITSPSSNGIAQIQYSGTISNGLTGLAAQSPANTASPVVVNTATGGLLKKASPVYGTDWIVGDCTAAGDLTLSWGVSKLSAPVSQLPALIPGVCTLRQFGAVGGGTTGGGGPNDYAAWALAVAALVAGTFHTLIIDTALPYRIDGTELDWPAGASLVGFGDSSQIIKTTNVPLTKTVGESTLFRNFRVTGNDGGGGLGFTSQNGLNLAVSGIGNSPARCTIEGVTFEELGGKGVQLVRSSILGTIEGIKVLGCRFHNCNQYGVFISEVCENVIVTGCNFYHCGWNLYIGAGNATVAGCTINGATVYNVKIEHNDANDAHGIISGCNITHGASGDIQVLNCANGFTFSGCHITGAGVNGITVTNSVGVQILGGQVDQFAYNITSSSFVHFNDVDFQFTLANTMTIDASSYVLFRPTLNFTGVVPSFITPFLQPNVVVGTGTNNLTKQQSTADRIVIQAGGPVAAFTLLGAFPPYRGMPPIVVINNNAQTCNFGFSTGGTVAVAAGAIATIGCIDGTNAAKAA
jgi:uncharacterized protein YjbI with pentapeptide repeats